jgi:hypothetical protein
MFSPTKVDELEVTILTVYPKILVTYKGVTYQSFRDSGYVCYEDIPVPAHQCIEVQFPKSLQPGLCTCLTFIPVLG